MRLCTAICAALLGATAASAFAAIDSTATDKLFHKVRDGGTGVLGQVGMPPNAQISDADLQSVIAWILAGPPEH